jgi:N-methylhydantoinase B/oxoprolinase/acetone carboxylase alpha subunit
MEIDPVTLAVLNGRLEQIADEMDATLFRSAFNPIIAEAHDASHGLYHARTGETLVQGKLGLPVFVGAMSFAVKTVIDKLAREGAQAQPGDVYIFNDPYEGGTHLSDFKLMQPSMVSKMTGIQLQHRDRVRLETPGGGGFGVPFERDTAAVAQDVRLGLVSVESAQQAYGVAIDCRGSIDAARTAKLRAQTAAES